MDLVCVRAYANVYAIAHALASASVSVSVSATVAFAATVAAVAIAVAASCASSCSCFGRMLFWSWCVPYPHGALGGEHGGREDVFVRNKPAARFVHSVLVLRGAAAGQRRVHHAHAGVLVVVVPAVIGLLLLEHATRASDNMAKSNDGCDEKEEHMKCISRKQHQHQ